MKYYIKIIVVYIARIVLRLFYLFPVKKNKILFSAYEGLSYNCNPKYIFQYIYDRFGDRLDYYWCLNDQSKLPIDYVNIKSVRFLSIAHIYHLMTSKCVVTNMAIEPIIPKREKQVFISTWHGGGAYKQVNSYLNVYEHGQSKYVASMREIRNKMTNYVLSSCQKFTDVMSVDFNMDKRIFLPVGMARNDLLLTATIDVINDYRVRICKRYNVDPDKTIILYAPTFRGSYRLQREMDTELLYSQEVTDAFRNRFRKECVIMYRRHITPNEKDKEICDGAHRYVDVTDYMDMQELLLIADVLITDYSSSIWDFSFTRKPAFLYVPDLEQYTKEVNFYTPISSWPYPKAETLNELCEVIKNYDEREVIANINKHHEELGSFENGHACESACSIIKKEMGL